MKILQRLIKNAFTISKRSLSECHDTKRGNFSVFSEKDIVFFENLIGRRGVITDVSDLEPHNIDFLKQVKGQSQLMLQPKTSAEVAEIIKYCNVRKLALCPQGGNTGLVGGGVPIFDEIILSTSRLDRIIALDKTTGILSCEGGCILGNLDTYTNEHDLMMPLDLGSKNSCQIGGNVATNAGGLRVLRYGNLHGTIVGMEVVLGNGNILDCMSTMRKDNTGYDIKQLFIGSEGTLGVITKVSILCSQLPMSINVAILGLNTYENVLETLSTAKKNLSEILSSCEYFDYTSMNTVETVLGLKNPISNCPHFMILETSGSRSEHDQEKLFALLKELMENGIVQDGTVVSDSRRVREIWSLRERIPEALLRAYCVYSYDISLEIPKFYELLQYTKQKIGDKPLTSCGFGHLGDGNLHVNLLLSQPDEEVSRIIEPRLFNWIRERRGSISAEHGIGFGKKKYIGLAKSQLYLNIMWKLKELFDPNGILNPYKVLI